MTFGSRTIVAHLGRGLAGLAALAGAAAGYPEIGWPALLLIGPAVWALRGCPVCWTIGLLETLALKVLRDAEA